jgi:hypothetical protein
MFETRIIYKGKSCSLVYLIKINVLEVFSASMEQDSSGIQAGQPGLRILFLARVEVFVFFTESRTGSGAYFPRRSSSQVVKVTTPPASTEVKNTMNHTSILSCVKKKMEIWQI